MVALPELGLGNDSRCHKVVVGLLELVVGRERRLALLRELGVMVLLRGAYRWLDMARRPMGNRDWRVRVGRLEVALLRLARVCMRAGGRGEGTVRGGHGRRRGAATSRMDARLFLHCVELALYKVC